MLEKEWKDKKHIKPELIIAAASELKGKKKIRWSKLMVDFYRNSHHLILAENLKEEEEEEEEEEV